MSDTDPTPETPTTLGDRLAWFRGDIDASFTTMGGKLDAMTTLLADIKTALTSSSGNIDAAPIVAAIQALAGPAPGTTLTDLFTVANGIRNNVGFPTGDATTTLLGLLASVQYALTHSDAGNASLYSKVHSIMNSLILPAIIDNTILGELEAIRLAQLATNAALSTSLPPQTCASPYESIGLMRYSLPGYTTPATAATWDEGSAPAGISFVGSDIAADDWSQWRVYVAARAGLFGYDASGNGRYQANKWWIFAGSGAKRFYVDGDSNISVVICPIDDGGSGVTYVTLAGGSINASTYAVQVPGYTFEGGDCIGDGSGHSFRFVTGTPTRESGGPGGVGDPRIAYEPGVFRAQYPQFSINQWYHITNPTTSFGFYSFLDAFSLDWADGIMPGSIAI
jgi:hypothetical protein